MGGQLVAQAVLAAEQTIREDWSAHSVHAYFLKAADEYHPVDYKVERVRDGKPLAGARVAAKLQPVGAANTVCA
ncbi:acyl-CoA thioesterase domain-containing protein [Bradyrhizobium sp. 521_C7_N1_3]|uniref:acyl-CoA thioesterase domain-containing protein n=1 Tax=Bradyrhizobium sp. 521_C7_N1_3 TaxID=3240368 RepID=UPI003F8A538C